DFTARLVAAAINRAEVVSGWDLARHRPKPAQRVAPVGSVYWFDDLEGDPGGLEKLIENGLWPLIDKPDATRMAEGFNNVLVAAWPQE
ncbi:MAG: type III-B CRISPR module-associated protein Cmr3, partial [Thermodesulfobacteriota bacterium]